MFECSNGSMLEVNSEYTLRTMTGKSRYHSLVKVLHQGKLLGQVDTPWGVHLTLTEAQKPEQRELYKAPLTRRLGDLPWRLLHAVLPLDASVSMLNPGVKPVLFSCAQRETVVPCFPECAGLFALLHLLSIFSSMFHEVFSSLTFILCRYSKTVVLSPT